MASGRRLESVCLLIADLSGYTSYLMESEPEQAPIIAGDVLETIVGRLRGRFRLAKLEGDAAFMYAPLDAVDGQAVLDAVDAAYFAFQRRLQSLSQATDCECNACRRLPQLDLKFVVHVGDALRHRIAGRDELAGRAVIVAHRLLKGSAIERAGARSYLMLTTSATAALGLDPVRLGLVPIVERYSDLGEVNGSLLDLTAPRDGRHGSVDRARPRGRLVARLESLVPLPPAMTWELLTVPARRSAWEGITMLDETIDVRRGVGTRASCVADRLASVEEILEWRPFEKLVRRVERVDLGRLTAVYRLSGVAQATHLETSWFGGSRGVPGSQAAERLIAEQERALDRLAGLAGRFTAPLEESPAVR